MVQGLSLPTCKESRQRLNAGQDVEFLQAPWSWPLGKELFLLWVRAQWPGKWGPLDWNPWGDTQDLRDFGKTSPLPTTWKESSSTQQGSSSWGGPRPVESAARALWISGLWPRLCQKVWLPPRSLGVLSVLQIMVHQCNPPLAFACTSSHAQSSRCVWDPSLASNREPHLSYWSRNPAERKGQGVMTVLANQHRSRIPSIQSVSHWTHPSGGHQWDLSKTRKCQALMRTICDSPSAEVEVQALEHGLLVLFHHFLPLNRTELLVVLTSLLRSCVFLSMRLHPTSSVSFISRFSPGVTSSRKLSLNPQVGWHTSSLCCHSTLQMPLF